MTSVCPGAYTADNFMLSKAPASTPPPPLRPGASCCPTLALQHWHMTSCIACPYNIRNAGLWLSLNWQSRCMRDKTCKACRVASTLKISSAATYCSGAMQCAGGLGGALFAVVAREEQGEALGGWPPKVEAWHGPSGGGSCLLTDCNRSDDKCW